MPLSLIFCIPLKNVPTWAPLHDVTFGFIWGLIVCRLHPEPTVTLLDTVHVVSLDTSNLPTHIPVSSSPFSLTLSSSLSHQNAGCVYVLVPAIKLPFVSSVHVSLVLLVPVTASTHFIVPVLFVPLSNLILISCGVFVLPSIYEPWALVLQEFAAAGLPILCSSICGASPHFVINNYNGYTFTAGDVLFLISQVLRFFLLFDWYNLH